MTNTSSRFPAVSEPVPLLSAKWALTARHLVVCLLLGVLFLYVSYRPLVNSQVWANVSIGRLILESRALPASDPTQPLAEGVRVIDTCWLSEVGFAVVDGWGGPHAVATFFALAALAYFAVLAWVFYLQSGRLALVPVGLGLVLLFGAGPPKGASPEIFGLLGLAVLFWVVMRLGQTGFAPLAPAERGGASSGRYWLAVLILFALWANLHGSYLLGLLVLVGYASARAVQVAWTSRSPWAAVGDEATQRWFLLTQAAVVATFFNPYGLALTLENFRLAFNDHVRAAPQWVPLSLASSGGVLFVLSVVALALVLRHSRRTVQPAEVILLSVFACGVVISGKALGWYAAVFAFVLVPHLGEILDARFPKKSAPQQGPLTPESFRFTFLCGLVVYCSFAWSPFSGGFFGGKPRDMESLVGDWAPYGAAEYLAEHPAPGLVYAPVHWADWLVYQGSPDTRVAMTSNVQWATNRVWSDHLRMSQCEEGWWKGMDRYGVTTLVIDVENQGSLAKSVRSSDRYAVVYEDDVAVIAQRVDEYRKRKEKAAGNQAKPEPAEVAAR